MHIESAALDRRIEAGGVFCRRGFQLEKKRPVDQLDEDAAILDGLPRIGDLDQLASEPSAPAAPALGPIHLGYRIAPGGGLIAAIAKSSSAPAGRWVSLTGPLELTPARSS
jgi:hypothetical protein